MAAHLVARLPEEVATHVVALCGVRTCAILRHFPALRLILRAYYRQYVRDNTAEQAALDALLEQKWSGGVQMVVQLGLTISMWCDPAKWEGILLSSSTIKLMWHAARWPSYSTVVYNLIADEADVDALLKWCGMRSRAFCIDLGKELLRRGGSLDQLRALCIRTGIYVGERFLATKFFTAAARYGRLDIVRYFDSVAPEVAMERTWPMRRAMQNGHVEVVRYLLERAWDWDVSGVVHDAATYDDPEIVEWLYERSPATLWSPTVEDLLRNGHLDLVQRLWRQGHAWYGAKTVVPSGVMTAAIASNHIPALQWLFSINPGCCKVKNMYSHLSTVAQTTFQWVLEHAVDKPGQQLLKKSILVGRQDLTGWVLDAAPHLCTSNCLAVALAHDHMDLAKWLEERLNTPGKVARIKAEARAWAKHGHWIKLAPFITDHTNCQCTPQRLQLAIVCGLVDAAEMMLYHHPDMVINMQALVRLCQCGNLPMIKWLCRRIDITTPFPSAMDNAAEFGQAETVQWLHFNTQLGCSKAAIGLAAALGRLDIVRFLHEHRSDGCTRDAMDKAAAGGHIDMLAWLHEHRTEGCTSAAVTQAAEGGLLDTVRWLCQHYPSMLTADAMDAAAGAGWLDVVQFLHTEYSAPCTVSAMNVAAANGFLDMVRWLHDNRTEGYTDQAVLSAAEAGHFSVVRFLYEQGYRSPYIAVWDGTFGYIKAWCGPPDAGGEI
ncbi:hypothetical protein RI367_003672 [Sorochytrium milnesiophthora]